MNDKDHIFSMFFYQQTGFFYYKFETALNRFWWIACSRNEKNKRKIKEQYYILCNFVFVITAKTCRHDSTCYEIDPVSGKEENNIKEISQLSKLSSILLNWPNNLHQIYVKAHLFYFLFLFFFSFAWGILWLNHFRLLLSFKLWLFYVLRVNLYFFIC